MNIPFRLEEGIFFEDTGNLLAWGRDIKYLKEIDNPEVSEDGKLINWKNKLCFGGLKLNITIRVDNNLNKNGLLAFVEFSSSQNRAREAYKIHSSTFRKLLGEPTDIQKDLYDFETILWTFGELQIIIGLVDKYTEYEVFGIHKGKPYWSLGK